MAGLYIRELIMRADARRVLIVAPGSLVEQRAASELGIPVVPSLEAIRAANRCGPPDGLQRRVARGKRCEPFMLMT